MSASSFKTLVTHRPKGVVVVHKAYRDRSVSAQFAANEAMVARGARLLLVS